MAFEYTLLDSFSIDGLWSLPGGEPDKRLWGRLSYDPRNGLRLETSGFFESIWENPFELRPRREIIHGITSSSDLVTLVDCVSCFCSPKDKTARYGALWMIVGEQVPSVDAIRYSSMSVNFHNLEEFIGHTGFCSSSLEDVLSIGYRHPKPVQIQSRDFSITAEFSARLDVRRYEEARIAQRGWLTFTARHERHFREYLTGPVAVFHKLLNFALGERAPVVVIEGRTAGTAQSQKAGASSRVFFLQKGCLSPSDRKAPQDFMFTLSGLGDRLLDVVTAWQEGFEAFREALDIYFSLDPDSDTDVALEHHFLSAVDALECFHRRAGKSQCELPDHKHEARVEAILEKVPLEHREWLKGRLRYSNEVSLRSRVKELYGELPENVKGLVGPKKQFADEIVNTRNYLVHHSPELKDSALRGIELWRATTRLRLTLQVCLLRKMGFSEEEVSSAIRRSRDYVQLERRGQAADW